MLLRFKLKCNVLVKINQLVPSPNTEKNVLIKILSVFFGVPQKCYEGQHFSRNYKGEQRKNESELYSYRNSEILEKKAVIELFLAIILSY